MYVADILLGLMLVGNCSRAGAESYGSKKILLAQDRRMLEIFSQCLCQFGILGSGLTSVEDVDAPEQSPGEEIPYGYVGIW